MLWLIHVTSTEIHVVLKKNALFRWLFFGMVNSYISANVNTVYPQQRKRVSLYVEPDTHLFARLRRKRKLFHSSGLTLSVSGHVLTACSNGHWWLSSTCEAHEARRCNGHTSTTKDWKTKRCRITNCTAAARMLVIRNTICSRSNTTGVNDAVCQGKLP